MYLGFESVDPLRGDYPALTAGEIGQLPERMRSLLAGRTPEDLNVILTWIDQHIEHAQLARLQSAAGESDQVASDDNGVFESGGTEVRALLWCLTRYTLDTWSWSEVFAVLSLALLNEAAEAEKLYSNKPYADPVHRRWYVLYNVSTWTTEAVEAGAFAEALSRGMPETSLPCPIPRATGARQRKRVSLRHQKAAHARHAPTRVAVREATQLYQSGQFETIAAAVRAYCRRNPNKVSHLDEGNRFRTLTQGVSRQCPGVLRQAAS